MKFRKFLTRSYKDFGLLILRLVAGGVMMLSHGIGKLTSFNDMFHDFGNPIGLGSETSYILTVFAEVFCAFALMIGLFTRFVAIPLMITMAVAFLIVHADDPFGRKELAFIYFSLYLTLFFTGPGKYSVDNSIL